MSIFGERGGLSKNVCAWERVRILNCPIRSTTAIVVTKAAYVVLDNIDIYQLDITSKYAYGHVYQ